MLLFISGYAGVTEQAAFVILVSVTALLFMVPLGLSVTACTLIGNSIGRQDVPLAKRFFKLISEYTLVYCLIMAVVLVVFRAEVAGLFTD